MKTYKIREDVWSDYEVSSELGPDVDLETRWTEEEIEADAENFKMSKEDFVDRYMEEV